MAYPFPSPAPSHHSPQYLTVHTPRSRSNSRHSRHRSHSHSGHRDHAVYPPNVAYTTHSDYQYPVHRQPSHHSPYHHPSHSTHHLPHYVQSTPSAHSHHSHHSHSRSYTPAHHHHRDRAPSISDRVRHFFGMDRPDQYSHHHHHQPHHQSHYHTHSNDHRRRHNSFSSFREEPRIHRSNSVRTGPLFFGTVDNRRYLDEHGREIDHRGRVIHRM